MADTKKEHYVPRCYLENFEGENKRIKVFDKVIMQIRSQLKGEIAAENYFYDINFDDIMENIDSDKHQSIVDDIKEISGIDDWDTIKNTILNPKHIEKEFFCKLEGVYGPLLKEIIKKSYNGNEWVMKNCRPFSEDEKIYLSLLIAVQSIRTRAYRDTMKQMVEKTYETLAYKQQMKDEGALPKEAFKVKANDDFIKLQHSEMMLDEEIAIHLAETLMGHIWVMYVNKTDHPFYTSDNPVLTIPHKRDKYMSYGGYASDGVEVVFPISPNLLIAMYEKKRHSNHYEDRTFIPIYDKDIIDYYNGVQVVHSFRCVFSQVENFELAEKLCEEHREIRDSSNRVSVS